MVDLIQEHFPETHDYVARDPVLFGDYRNALTEEPRLYEDIVDYDAAKAIFEEVLIIIILNLLDFYMLRKRDLSHRLLLCYLSQNIYKEA